MRACACQFTQERLFLDPMSGGNGEHEVVEAEQVVWDDDTTPSAALAICASPLPLVIYALRQDISRRLLLSVYGCALISSAAAHRYSMSRSGERRYRIRNKGVVVRVCRNLRADTWAESI